MTVQNKPVFKVQKRVAVKGRDAKSSAGWVTIATSARRPDAERKFRHARIDNPDNEVRLEGPAA